MAASGRLEGRVAIITGGGSGIGKAACRIFADEGASVLAVDLPGSGVGETFSNADRIEALEADITAPGAPAQIVDTAMDRFGRLDILFNNAGVVLAALAQDMDDELWDRTMDVNLNAQFRLARAAIPHLVKSPAGRIVATASVMAEGTDNYGLAAYCASKAGVGGLIRTLAYELGKHGVTANYIMPGAIKTGMTRDSFADKDIAEIWAKKSALRRLGEPEDIARMALFLASDEAAFVTGQGIKVDGGIMLRV
jgi:3-oxoacyl-[acyl-carrier protein] reductase